MVDVAIVVVDVGLEVEDVVSVENISTVIWPLTWKGDMIYDEPLCCRGENSCRNTFVVIMIILGRGVKIWLSFWRRSPFCRICKMSFYLCIFMTLVWVYHCIRPESVTLAETRLSIWGRCGFPGSMRYCDSHLEFAVVAALWVLLLGPLCSSSDGRYLFLDPTRYCDSHLDHCISMTLVWVHHWHYICLVLLPGSFIASLHLLHLLLRTGPRKVGQ